MATEILKVKTVNSYTMAIKGSGSLADVLNDGDWNTGGYFFESGTESLNYSDAHFVLTPPSSSLITINSVTAYLDVDWGPSDVVRGYVFLGFTYAGGTGSISAYSTGASTYSTYTSATLTTNPVTGKAYTYNDLAYMQMDTTVELRGVIAGIRVVVDYTPITKVRWGTYKLQRKNGIISFPIYNPSTITGKKCLRIQTKNGVGCFELTTDYAASNYSPWKIRINNDSTPYYIVKDA